MRLFIAVNFSGEMNNSLYKSVSALREAAEHGSFTHRENLHLTLVFIGETGRTDAVMQAIDAVEAAPFDLFVGGLGKFKRGGRYIYWIGVEESPALLSLHAKLFSALRGRDFEIGNRDLKPHITLGRNVAVRDGFDEAALGAGVPNTVVRVGHISLMKSEHIGGRLTYTEIYRKPLLKKGEA